MHIQKEWFYASQSVWYNACLSTVSNLVFQCINICQVPWNVENLVCKNLPLDLANVNKWKDMFDP